MLIYDDNKVLFNLFYYCKVPNQLGVVEMVPSMYKTLKITFFTTNLGQFLLFL